MTASEIILDPDHAALPDLFANIVKWNADAMAEKRLLPRACVKVYGVEQGAVDIEQYSFDHRELGAETEVQHATLHMPRSLI